MGVRYERPMKRARRGRVTAEPPGFLGAPGFHGGGSCREGARMGGASFRDNVRRFLALCCAALSLGEPGAGALGAGGAAWQMAFPVGGEGGEAAVLEVVEEDVPRSRRVYCEQCTVAGWSRHPVCGKRYHFIIRNENMPSCKTCRRCGLMVELFESRCPSCNQGFSLDDQEDWDYLQLENPLHLLHGVVHENGYGHLVRINGREGGSTHMTGHELMDFWDRLCKYLRVRKVSVMDVSKKYGVDYRILLAVTAGCSWYGRWGFKLGNGSFGITFEAYCRAIDNISSVPLSRFFPYSRSPRNQLQDTIAFYQSLSNHPLTTLHDLFLYVLGLATSQSANKLPVPMDKDVAYDASFQERKWTDNEIKRAMDITLKILRAADRWVSMRNLKAVLAHPVGSIELVVYCLKTIAGIRTDDGMAVAVRCNSEANTIEYRLMTETTVLPENECKITRDHLLRDIKFLYNALLYPHTMHPYKPERIHEQIKRSAMILLDCKQFIKHYDLEEDFVSQNPSMLHIWCQVELLDQVGDPPCVPLELITLAETATIADLKMEVTRTFQDIYPMFQTFVANRLLDCATASDNTQIKLLFGTDGTVHIQGMCVGGERRIAMYRMERGADKWTVNCTCGAKDDDGERMLSCDTCHVWQHTRCAGISDLDQVPKRFVCKSCKLLQKRKSNEPRLMYSGVPYKRCKTKAGAFSHVNGGFLRPHIR